MEYNRQVLLCLAEEGSLCRCTGDIQVTIEPYIQIARTHLVFAY